MQIIAVHLHSVIFSQWLREKFCSYKINCMHFSTWRNSSLFFKLAEWDALCEFISRLWWLAITHTAHISVNVNGLRTAETEGVAYIYVIWCQSNKFSIYLFIYRHREHGSSIRLKSSSVDWDLSSYLKRYTIYFFFFFFFERFVFFFLILVLV